MRFTGEVHDGARAGKGCGTQLSTWRCSNAEPCEFYLAFQVIRKVYLSAQRLKTYMKVVA